MTTSVDQRTLLREAVLLERAGRLSEAENTYERLLARWPDLPDGWYNLAILQRKARRFDAALASYQRALEQGVTQPEEVHLNRGVIYSDCLRQDAAAERELNAALALKPDYLPALLNLANLREDLGQRDAALALYERILALDPGSCEGLARYAELKSAASADDPLVARLTRAIAEPRAAPPEKARLGFALGKVLDGDIIRIQIDRNRGEGSIDLVGVGGQRLSPEEAARLLSSRSSRDDLAPHPALPEDTRLWAALQQAGGGTWSGCVYDADRILAALAAIPSNSIRPANPQQCS